MTIRLAMEQVQLLAVLLDPFTRAKDELLQNILIEPRGDYITVQATDGVMFAVIKLDADIGPGAKPLYFQYKRLRQFLTVWNEPITLTSDSTHVIIRTSHDELTLPLQQEASKFIAKFDGLRPPKSGITIPNLPYLLTMAGVYTLSIDDNSMPILQGIHIHSMAGSKVRVEATNKFTMVMFTVDASYKQPLNVVIDGTARNWGKLPSGGQVASDSRYLYYITSVGIFAIQSLQGSYPDFSVLDTWKANGNVTLSRAELEMMVKKCNFINSAPNAMVTWEVDPDAIRYEIAGEGDAFDGEFPIEKLEGVVPGVVVQVSDLAYTLLLTGDKSMTIRYRGDKVGNAEHLFYRNKTRGIMFASNLFHKS